MRTRVRKIIKVTSAVFALLMVLALSFAYLQYHELKKAFLSRISDRATSFIGQKVEIRDMSFSYSLGINLRDIIVKNPEGFSAGELLKIENLYLRLRYREFIKGKLYFEKITVHEPQLFVVQDKDGRINISDTLRDFFKRKPGFRYRIDEFSVRSGSVGFARMGVGGIMPKRIFKAETVNFRINDLSSDPGVKTLFEGETLYAGNILKIRGWAYMKDEPKRLNISISSKDMTLVPMKEILGRYGIDSEKTKITFELNAEGDTEKGIYLRSKADLKKAGFAFFKKEGTDIRIDMQAFLNISENTLLVRDISLEAGSINAATLAGEIRKSKKGIYYSADVKIRRLDVSSLNFLKDMKIGGIMTSENLRVRGNLKEHFPEISGVIRLKGGAFKSDSNDIGGIDAEFIFYPGLEISLSSRANAKISKVSGYLFDEPADAIVGLTARGNLKKMDLTSSVNLAHIEIPAKSGKSASLDSIAFYLDSTMKDRTFEGEVRTKVTGIQYNKYQSPWLLAKAHIAYKNNVITLKTPVIEEKDFRITARNVAIMPERTGNKVRVEMQDLSASYPAREAGIRNADVYSNIVRIRDIITGDFRFSAGGIEFSGFHAGLIEGSGEFDERRFTLDIPAADISGGRLKLDIQGRTSRGPFPITIVTNAENIDLSKFPEEALKTAGVSYGMSGNLKRADLEGTMQSWGIMQGDAIIHAENLSLLGKDKRHVVKDASLTSNISFKGKDLDFKADAKAGGMLANVSGTIREFAGKHRAGEMSVSLPEVKLVDIREAFWEIFPDGLLYTGLEGSFSSKLSVRVQDSAILASGKVTLKNIVLTGENGEYSVGPITGVVPLEYGKPFNKREPLKLPSFERTEFGNLRKYYSGMKLDTGYSRISIGSVSYGFRFLEDVDLWIRQEGQFLNIGRFSGRIFGGRLNGSATVELVDGMQYRAGFILEGLSLVQLCDSIEPIKGYISGKVSGTATLKGKGTGLADLMGKAEFWTYSTRNEKTKISREFLRKVGGPSVMKYLGDRNFDKGVMDLYLQNGFVVFRELEISNRNLFGVKDLDIKVAPLSNRIALDHLMWSITEAAYRAKKEKG